VEKKKTAKLIDSKYLKILAAKKEDLRGSIVFICLDEEKYGALDKAGLRKITQLIDQIEPNGCYFPLTKNMNIEMYDASNFFNKDVIVTVQHDSKDIDRSAVENDIRTALSSARSVTVIHNAEIRL